MANKEIPSIPAADTLTGDEQIHIVQGGNSRRVTLSDLAALLGGGGGGTGIESFIIPLSDEGDSDITTVDGAASFPMPYDFNPTAFYLDVKDGWQPNGGPIEVNVRVDGAIITDTPVTIDEDEISSRTSATPCVFDDSMIPAGSTVTFDIINVGPTYPGGALKATMVGTQA